MKLTGIGPENAKAFEPLWGSLHYTDYDLCVGAVEDDTASGGMSYQNAGYKGSYPNTPGE